MKFYPEISCRHTACMRQVLLIMRLVIILLTAGILQVSAASYAQKINIQAKNESLEKFLNTVKQQSGYDFVCDQQILKDADKVTVTLKDATIDQALNGTLNQLHLTYTVSDKLIVIEKKEPSFFEKLKAAMAAIDVTGRVTDENGQPLAGATVIVKNTGNATNTDANGNFTLKNVQPNDIIVITFIGYDKKEVSAKSALGLIQLIQASSKLDEVKVTAYGQTTDRLGVGDITAVSAKTIEKQPVSNPLTALEGRVTGLFITQASGVPGSTLNVTIQGRNSIQNGNDPFYVVDGVPYVPQLLANFGGGILGISSSGSAGTGSPFNYLNPQDIESISVLKDADATAIYGSRAANGAILITTKKGKKGDTKVNFNIQNGWGNVTRELKLLNTQQYLQMRREAIKNDGLAVNPNLDYDLTQWDTTRYTDWQKELIGKTATYKDYSVSVSGGTDQVQYLVSSTFHRETTVFPGDFADTKGAVHFSLSTQSLNKRFRMQFSGNYLHDNNHLPNADLTSNAITLAPDAPALYNPDGSVNWAYTNAGAYTWINPLYTASNKYTTTANNLVGNAVLSYEIIQGLQIKTSFGYTDTQQNDLSTYPAAVFPQSLLAYYQRSAQYSNNNGNTWIIEPQITYNRNFGKDAFSLLIGSTASQSNANSLRLSGSGYSNDLLLSDFRSAPNISISGTTASVYKYNALFAQLNNNWNGKYLLNATIRRDGSSRFGTGSQFHNFWSVGGGWIFSEEKAIKNNFPWFSLGKVRASYGTTGNDQIGDYQFMSLYNSNNVGIPYQGTTGLQVGNLSNPNLAWEETQKLSLGTSLGFLKDRIVLEVGYYRNRSSNQLLSYALPYVTGFSSVPANLPATVQNSGWELQLNTTNIKANNFSWETSFNFTANRNKLIRFDNLASSSFANSYIIGRSILDFYVYNFAGVNPATGQYQFVGSNGQVTSSPDKQTVLISTTPKFFGGFDNSFRYKRFDLSFFFQFVKQNALGYKFGQLPGLFLSGNGNQPISVLQRWQNPGDQTNIQRFYSNGSLSTQYQDANTSTANYTDASYIRLKNLSLAYSLPENVFSKMGLKNARLYIQAQNLLTFTKYTGLDPENQSRSSLPPLRVFTFGVQAGF